MRQPRVAIAVATIAVLLAAGTLATYQDDLYIPIIAVSFAAVGGLLGARRPENPIGWLFLGFGAVGAVHFCATAYADHALVRDPGSLPGGDVAASIQSHLWHPAFGLLVFAFLLFPDGRLLSARWRPFARVAAAVYIGLLLSGPFDGAFLREDVPLADPLVGGGAERIGSAVFTVLLMANLVCLVTAAASLLLRLRRARGNERQQVKWFVVPVAFVMVAFPVSVLLAGDGRFGVWLFPLVPASAAVAVLRYRLYDIDVVINRALVYTVLTVSLAGTYLVTVLLVELVLPARSGLVTALSTLVVAGIFQPARRRIQAAVDRRFFRHRVDAQTAVDTFSRRLRDTLDLDAVDTDLCAAVADAMHPTHVSLWLRTR